MDKTPKQILPIVVLMVFTLGFGIDLYSPSFPSIVSKLQTTNQLVQLTISTYFIGYILGLLVLGPLSDSFGRKKILLYGLSFYCLMSFFCSISSSIVELLFFRLFQGMGVGAVGVGFRSIVTDVYQGKQLAKAMTYTSMSYRIGPIIAPLFGGYLVQYFNWESNFYFLTVYSLLIIVIIGFFLPETHHERDRFHPKSILLRYLNLLKKPFFIGGSLCVGIFYGMMIVFNVVAPFFIEDVLGFSPVNYGHIAFGMGVVAFFGIFLNRFLLHFFATDQLIHFGMYSAAILGLIFVGFAFFFPKSLSCFVIFPALIFFTTGLFNPNIMSQIMGHFSMGKGIASALMAIIIMSCSFLLSAFSSFLKSATIRPFSLAYLGMLLIGFLSYQLLFNRRTLH